MWISLDQIEALSAIDQAGSITQAAVQLRKAKSAVYYAIRKLEEQLGFEVLSSDNYRGNLTEKGKQVLLCSRQLLAANERLKEDIHRIANGAEMYLSISATALFDLRTFNKQIKKLQSTFPYTQLTIHRELLSGDRLLETKDVDIAITERTVDSTRFDSKKIATVKMSLMIASSHQFLSLKKKDQTLESLLKYPQVVQSSTLPNNEQHGIFSEARKWVVSDLTSKKIVIQDGLGWGRLPSHEVESEVRSGKLTALNHVETPVEIPLYIARRISDQHGEASNALWHEFSDSTV